MRRWVWVASFVVVTLLSSVATASPTRTLTPVKVLGGPENQNYGSSNGTYLGWSQNSTSSPKHYNAYVMNESTSVKRKINPSGTEAWFGSFVTDQNRAIFQLVTNGQSDIKFYDVDAKAIRPVPSGINTKSWEWSPRTTGTNIAFMRWDANKKTQTAYVWVQTSDTIRKLASVGGNKYLQTESAGDRYVTYQRCDATTCKEYVYDIQNKSTSVIPTKGTRPQYGSSLDESHDWVYFVRSGNGCGVDVHVFRVPIDNLSAAPTTMAVMPKGIDVFYTSVAFRSTDGRVDLMLQRAECAKNQYSDIYALRGVDTIP
jgi:hypothetical protein